ncbi:MAG: C-GCAxxG-C-C family protein [Chloroflexota bacterium]
MEKSENARVRFDQGMNCSQAVFTAFAEDFGLDEETAIKVASAFGGGVARTGAICGAVSGALMVLGMKHGARSNTDPAVKANVYAIGQDFLQRFAAQNGAIDCKDLLGCDISTAEGQQQARQQNLFQTRCPRLVQSAVTIVEELSQKEHA